jgi:AbrB family looped-hinge helix DNA binding protein
MPMIQRSRITSKRQVTFPKAVMDEMGLKAGDSIVIEKRADGFYIRSSKVREDMLAPLKGRLTRGVGTFEIGNFRDAPKDPALRD